MGNTFGSWSTGYTNGTSYQATYDCFVVVKGSLSTGGVSITGFTDSSNPPTTVVQQQKLDPSLPCVLSIMFPVRKGDYFKVQIEGGSGSLPYYGVLPLGGI